MRDRSSRLRCMAAAALVVLVTTSPAFAEPHDAGGQSDAAAAKLTNPVKPETGSIAAGKKLYAAQCASCHGTAGRGDGKAGALLKPLPSDLTDGTWKHGSSDGEIFTLIRNGSKGTGMKAFGGRIPPQDIWHLVNYLRTLSSTPKSPH
jgi:mono/diheme cytochrome c family protein